MITSGCVPILNIAVLLKKIKRLHLTADVTFMHIALTFKQPAVSNPVSGPGRTGFYILPWCKEEFSPSGVYHFQVFYVQERPEIIHYKRENFHRVSKRALNGKEGESTRQAARSHFCNPMAQSTKRCERILRHIAHIFSFVLASSALLVLKFKTQFIGYISITFRFVKIKA